MEPGLIVAVVSVTLSMIIFMFGVVYQLGRFAARIESLEGWRVDVKHTFDELFRLIRQGERDER
ncbi:MAG: hypothetical protein WBC33_05925 [Conexibacter sp.]